MTQRSQNQEFLFSRFLPIAVVFMCLLSSLQAQLSGTYTIGGFKPDYATINTAVNDLNWQGVSGPVLFKIRPGTYSEQVTLYSVNGASKYNTITFTSESGNAADVVIRYYPNYTSEWYVLRFVGGTHYRILNLTLESTNPKRTRVIQAYGQGIQSLLIQGCRLIAAAYNLNDYQLSVITMRPDYIKDVHIRDNLIRGGTGAMHIQGRSSSLSTGTEITNNRIYNFGYHAASLGGLRGGKFMGNRIIGSARGTTPSKGVYLSGWNGTATTPVLVANNFLALPRSSHDGLILGSSSHVNVYHNSVDLAGGGWAIILNQSQSVAVKNNIFKSASGYAADVYRSTDLDMDYNDLFTSGGPVATYNGSVAADLAEWRHLAGQDRRSISVDPGFVSYKDLHATAVALLGAGVLVPGVKVDIDGDLRAKPPCIGADEFSKTVKWPYIYAKTELAGERPDVETPVLSVFPTPTSDRLNVAITDAYSGSVTLSVLDGLGRKVSEFSYEKDGPDLRTEITVSDLVPGVYLLRIEEGKEVTVKRFVKR